MIDTIIVGKNSFLARKFREQFSSEDFLFLSHDEALSQAPRFKNARIVLNFSFAPALASQPYESSLDSDFRLARMVGDDTHYIMLSSRMVYGNAQDKIEFSEETETRPVSEYGRNKLIVENSLKDIVASERLTILRMSNIFGFEPERKTFFGAALTNLFIKKCMTFDIAPESVRDFLPATVFTGYLNKILKSPKAGIFNIGSGIGITCLDITQWLIEGYGDGSAIFESAERKGEFILNVKKAKDAFSLEDVSIEDIRKACISCGQQLRNYRLTATA